MKHKGSRKKTVRGVPGSADERHRLRNSHHPLRREIHDDTPQHVSTYVDEALYNWFLIHTHVPVEFLDLDSANVVTVKRTDDRKKSYLDI